MANDEEQLGPIEDPGPQKPIAKPVQKQRATVYTMMLIGSFIALVLACVVLYLELQRYDFDIEAKDYRSSRDQIPVSSSTFLG